MRFLRIKLRRCVSEAPKSGFSAEDDEEGRRSLLIPGAAAEPCREPIKIELPDLKVLRLPADSCKQAVPLSQVFTFQAFIHCQGCARRVKKTLSKLQGVSSFHVDVDQQKVTVIGNVSADEVLQKMDEVLKGTQLWPASESAHASHRSSFPN